MRGRMNLHMGFSEVEVEVKVEIKYPFRNTPIDIEDFDMET